MDLKGDETLRGYDLTEIQLLMDAGNAVVDATAAGDGDAVDSASDTVLCKFQCG